MMFLFSSGVFLKNIFVLPDREKYNSYPWKRKVVWRLYSKILIFLALKSERAEHEKG